MILSLYYDIDIGKGLLYVLIYYTHDQNIFIAMITIDDTIISIMFYALIFNFFKILKNIFLKNISPTNDNVINI